jgi:hypothetical protein
VNLNFIRAVPFAEWPIETLTLSEDIKYSHVKEKMDSFRKGTRNQRDLVSKGKKGVCDTASSQARNA